MEDVKNERGGNALDDRNVENTRNIISTKKGPISDDNACSAKKNLKIFNFSDGIMENPRKLE